MPSLNLCCLYRCPVLHRDICVAITFESLELLLSSLRISAIGWVCGHTSNLIFCCSFIFLFGLVCCPLVAHFVMRAHAEEEKLMTKHSLSAIRSHLTGSCQSFYTLWMSQENSLCPDRSEASSCPHNRSACDDGLRALSSWSSFNNVQSSEVTWII